MCPIKISLFCLATFCILNFDISNADVHLDDWDHDHHHTSPEHWDKACKDGEKQSPIDIISNEVIKEYWGQPFVFHGYEQSVPMQVKNNRHTLVVEFSNDDHEDVWINGGGLGESKFQFSQLHFHWGSTNDQGSEHIIDGKSYPMEMHIVHWNLDVGKDPNSATKKDAYNSLEVLSVLFEVGEKNEKYDSFFNAAKDVSMENSTSTIENGLKLKDLLPEDTNSFYRYRGSLTTPPCNEIVMWTVFQEHINVSQSQLDIIRKVTYNRKGENEPRDISNNYRLPQKLNERNVTLVDTHIVHAKNCNFVSEDKNESDRASVISITVVVQLVVIGCIYLIIHRFNCRERLQKEEPKRNEPETEKIICA